MYCYSVCLSLCFPGLEVQYYNLHRFSALLKSIDVTQAGRFGFLSFYRLQKTNKQQVKQTPLSDKIQLPTYHIYNNAVTPQLQTGGDCMAHLAVLYGSL